MADDPHAYPEIMQQLTQLPRPGQDKWADRYAIDVPKLLGEVRRLARVLDAHHPED
jgi:hypothetical protein